MYAFVHIEKTGGSTLLSILRRSFGTGHCDIRLPLAKRRGDDRDHRACVEVDDLRRVQRLYRNLKGISGHNVKPYGSLAAARSTIEFITILRDPVARYRSHFLNRAPGHTAADFDRWVSAEWTNNWQTKMIAGEPDADKAIDLLASRFRFVGLTERFDESLLLLQHALDEPQFRPEYRAVNKLSEKRRPRDVARERSDMSYLATDEAFNRMADANREDRRLVEFVARQIYPLQIAAYTGDLAANLEMLQRRNQQLEQWSEPRWGAFVRNYIYKPLLHCRAV